MAAAFVLLILGTQVGAVQPKAAEPSLEVSLMLSKREYLYKPGEVVDGLFSISRSAHVQIWVQYPDGAWNRWFSGDRTAGTYYFARPATIIPRSVLTPGLNMLTFQLKAMDETGDRATDIAVCWLKVSE